MIDKTLLREITLYCDMNGIKDIPRLVNRMLERGFTIEKYGEIPIDIVKTNNSTNIEKQKNEYVLDIATLKNNIEEKPDVKTFLKIKENKKDFYGEQAL